LKKVAFIFGTRPEAIKLAPLVLAMRGHARLRPEVCVTAQHRQMLDQVLEIFGIVPDIDLNLMRPNQDLYTLTANLMTSMRPVMQSERPDWVLVQGDTTTVWTAALAAFYENVRVGHVEAGLRTFDKRQPFPEEINRRLCTQLTDLHFAPTALARRNLLAEGVPDRHVVVTGNTVIDSLLWVLDRIQTHSPTEVRQIQQWANQNIGDARMVLITGHRRESFGEGFENICSAIAELAGRFPDVRWVYPMHLNPNVQEPVRRILGRHPNIHLLDPLSYAPFAWLMQHSALILTDSGGIQEEAPSLGKRVLVMRNTTERPEGIEAGCTQLVGNGKDGIVSAVAACLSRDVGESDIRRRNPYGDGQSSRRIAEGILRYQD